MPRRKNSTPTEQEQPSVPDSSSGPSLIPSSAAPASTDTALAVVDEKRDAELNPIDPNTYIRNEFRDAIFRSHNVRGRMWSLVPKAHDTLEAILTEDITEKTMPTQFAAAKFVIETNLVKFPDVSHKTIEINDNRPPADAKVFKPVTRQEVIEAAVIAIEAEEHKGDDERPDDTANAKPA